MKKLLLLFFACTFFASFSYAQQKSDLKGPKAKNYKPWKDSSKKPLAVFEANPERLTGPQAKNKKPWDRNQSAEQYLAISTSNRSKLKGPKAKNWKPWQSEQPTKKVYVKTDAEKPKQERQGSQEVEMKKDNF